MSRPGGSTLTDAPVEWLEAPDSEVVSWCITVDSGSGDDPDHLPGLAHLLEHLASARSGTSGSLLEDRGGRRNAVTLGEVTLHTGTVARRAGRDVLLDELAHLGSGPVEREDILRESEIIGLEAAAGTPHGPARLLWSSLPSLALGVDELRLSGMGDPALLAAADVEEVRTALADRYRLGAVRAVAVGDGPVGDGVDGTGTDPDSPASRPGDGAAAARPVADLSINRGRLAGAVVLPVQPAAHDPRRYLATIVVCRLLRRLTGGTLAAFVGREGRWWSTRRTDLVTVALFGEDSLDPLRRRLHGPWSTDDLAAATASVALDLGRSLESTALRASQLATWDALVGRRDPVRDLLAVPAPMTAAHVGDLVDEEDCRAVAQDLLAGLDRVEVVEPQDRP